MDYLVERDQLAELLTNILNEIQKFTIQNACSLLGDIECYFYEIVKILVDIYNLNKKFRKHLPDECVNADEAPPNDYNFLVDQNLINLFGKIYGSLEECLNLFKKDELDFIIMYQIENNLRRLLSTIYKQDQKSIEYVRKFNYLMGSYLFNHQRKYYCHINAKQSSMLYINHDSIVTAKKLLFISAQLTQSIRFLAMEHYSFLENSSINENNSLYNNIKIYFSNIETLLYQMADKHQTTEDDKSNEIINYRILTNLAAKKITWEIDSNVKKLFIILDRIMDLITYFMLDRYSVLTNSLLNLLQEVSVMIMTVKSLIQFDNTLSISIDKNYCFICRTMNEIENETYELCSNKNIVQLFLIEENFNNIKVQLESILDFYKQTTLTLTPDYTMNWSALFQYSNIYINFNLRGSPYKYSEIILTAIYRISKLINLTDSLFFEDVYKNKSAFNRNLDFLIKNLLEIRSLIRDLNKDKIIDVDNNSTIYDTSYLEIYYNITDNGQIEEERFNLRNNDLNNSEKEEMIYKKIQEFNKRAGTTLVYACEIDILGVHLYISPKISKKEFEEVKNIVTKIMRDVNLSVHSCEEPTYEPSLAPGSCIESEDKRQTLGLYVKVGNDTYALSTGHDIKDNTVFSLADARQFAKVVKIKHDEEFDYSLSKIVDSQSLLQIRNCITKGDLQLTMYHSDEIIFYKIPNCEDARIIELFRNGATLEKISATFSKYRTFLENNSIKVYLIKCKERQNSIHEGGDSGLIVSTSYIEGRDDVFGLLILTGIVTKENEQFSAGHLLNDVFDDIKKDDTFKSLQIL